MGQIRHGSATTTHAVRAAIQRPQASLAHLRELGINPKTENGGAKVCHGSGGMSLLRAA